ncbi:MAG: lysophospholipid acyltransferase family protein [Gemmatimonadetes bacterium]|nr:lysophospholipid acyltransferase family protein [Gemmatimonadota bacterium]
MRSATLRHRLEYAGFRTLLLVLRALPERVALALGSGLGWLAGGALRMRRDVVDANLALAFPDRDERWRGRVAAESYRHLGREGVMAFRLGRAPARVVLERTDVDGLEALRDAVASGRGAVVVTGHLGNWEVGGAAVSVRGVAIDAVAFRQANPLFDDDLVRNRSRLGMRVVRKGDAPQAVLRALREGRVPALVADQDARRGGVFVDFMGVPAATARGPAVFALRAGADLFLGVALAREGRPRRYHVRLEPVRVERTGDVEEDVRRLTAAHTAALEAWVRRAPEQYFWQHRRWRTRPPEIRGTAAPSQEPAPPSPV